MCICVYVSLLLNGHGSLAGVAMRLGGWEQEQTDISDEMTGSFEWAFCSLYNFWCSSKRNLLALSKCFRDDRSSSLIEDSEICMLSAAAGDSIFSNKPSIFGHFSLNEKKTRRPFAAKLSSLGSVATVVLVIESNFEWLMEKNTSSCSVFLLQFAQNMQN